MRPCLWTHPQHTVSHSRAVERGWASLETILITFVSISGEINPWGSIWPLNAEMVSKQLIKIKLRFESHDNTIHNPWCELWLSKHFDIHYLTWTSYESYEAGRVSTWNLWWAFKVWAIFFNFWWPSLRLREVGDTKPLSCIHSFMLFTVIYWVSSIVLGRKGMTELMFWSRVSLPWHCGYFGLIIIYGAGSPVHWGMFNSISGLCPLDANRNSPVMTTKDVFWHLSRIGQGSGKNHTPLRTAGLERKGQTSNDTVW